MLFRSRMVFNILANNTDDHNKNFTFIMDRQGTWRLSPAYDMTYIFDTGGYLPNKDHCLMIGGKLQGITRDDAIQFARDNGIRRPDAIIRDVVVSLKQFRSIATKYGVSDEWTGRVETTIIGHLKAWGEWDESELPEFSMNGHSVSNIRMEQAYKGNYHLLAEIDGKERKFVIGKNKEEFALIEKTGISKPYSRPAASNGREIVIREATKAQASDIAQLIMMAMTDDCCQHFCGVGHGLEDFLKMMTSLVEREDSQYSYRNTFVAMADNKVVGIAVSYDGGRLHELRQAFIKAAKEYIGKDHSGMDDETQAGELYLDSLAVLPDYRRQGIAQCLLHATKEKADKMGQPCVGLLVDKGNPAGEALYASVGFQYANDSWWGGHPMKHLVLK